MLPYLHPVTGGVVLMLLAYVALLGFRLRARNRANPREVSGHARIAPWAYALVLLSWLSGAASTLFLRSDVDFAASLHFQLGSIIALLLTGSALTAFYMRRQLPQLREWHPWLGAAALLLAAAHAVAGLQLTP